jgi:pilus assembly protein CpaF
MTLFGEEIDPLGKRVAPGDPRRMVEELARTAVVAQPAAQRMNDTYQQLKGQICEQVIDQLEARNLTADLLNMQDLRAVIEAVIVSRSRRGQLALNSAERILLIEDVEDEVAGFGPISPLLRDPEVDDIIVNGPRNIYVERAGKLERIDTRFRDDAHLMNIIQRIVGPIGRRIDEANPYVDARLPDRSRINIVIPPVALDGPTVSIRKARSDAFEMRDFIERNVLTEEMADYLADAVRSRLNILISGGTGAGKSTLLNVLSGSIGHHERLVTIEDAAELQLRQEHVVRLETRPANQQGTREITARHLVQNALRMRPDRIILGEVRGAEAVEMLQAMSTGHDGSMSTIHGNAPRDALSRLELLMGFAGLQQEVRTIRRFIASSINLMVHVQRLADGSRKVVSIAEVTGVEGENYSLNELFSFVEDVPHSGIGRFERRSARPFFASRMKLSDTPRPASTIGQSSLARLQVAKP